MIKRNFVKLFEQSFKENWESPAFTDYFENQTFNYGQVATEIVKLHLLYEKCGIKQGDKIALIGKNTPRWCILYLSVVTYGGVIVPILQDFNPNDVHHIVNHSESVLLFASNNIWENLDEDRMPAIRGAFSLSNFKPLFRRDADIDQYMSELVGTFNEKYPFGYTKEDILYADVPNDRLIKINYTSGTTGFSKGVMLTGNNLAGNVTFAIDTKLLRKDSRVLSFLPLAHAFGCAFEFLSAAAAGSHVCLLGKIPAPKILIAAFQQVKPTVIFSVPLVLEKIYRNQILPTISKRGVSLALSVPILNTKIYEQINQKISESFGGAFEIVVVGGAALNREVEDFFMKIKFPLTVGYGMTECGPLISYRWWEQFVPGSVGEVLPKLMEAKIDSPNAEGIGEVLVRGENVMMGYYKNQEVTDEVIDKDGWLHTGDLGTLDSNNNIFLRGRNKTMILSASGQNIYPEEIEAKLNNMPFVMESLVVEHNKKLVALVYPDYESVDGGVVSRYDLDAIMEENLRNLNKIVASYETVSKIQLYPSEFEKTTKKSIKRYLYNQISD